MSSGASVKDVAAMAGVSVGTVSNVLNGRVSVSSQRRARVLAAIEELGFVRSEAARTLRAGTTTTIGMLVLDVRNPFFTDVALGAEDMAAKHQHSVILANTAENPQREAAYLDLFEEQRVRGVLISPIGDVFARLERMREHGIPSVLVDRFSRHGHFCSVSVDDVVGGRLAAQHLLDIGRSKVAFVGGPTNLEQVADRHAGAATAVDEADATLQWFQTPDLKFASGRQIGELICDLRQDRRPDGVFAANDQLALGLLQAFASKGIRVPDDIALVGYDDIDFAAQSSIPLTSIRQPRELLGRRAAELLFDEVDDGDDHHHIQEVMAPELITRRSTTGSGP